LEMLRALEALAVNNLHGPQRADSVAPHPDLAIGAPADQANQFMIRNPRRLEARCWRETRAFPAGGFYWDWAREATSIGEKLLSQEIPTKERGIHRAGPSEDLTGGVASPTLLRPWRGPAGGEIICVHLRFFFSSSG